MDADVSPRSRARGGAAADRSRVADAWSERLVRHLLRRAGDPPLAVVLWNGREIATCASRPRVRLVLRGPSTLLRVLADGEFQLPECYTDGSLEVEGDLVELFEILFRFGGAKPSWRSSAAYALSRVSEPLRHLRARSHARHHYDLSNDFYALWLDPSMTYTCAYYPTPETPLADAQQAKHELVCTKLGLKPGDHVIEAGCGWGSLAIHMARRHGATVTAYNVSHEQVAYARSWARREGLGSRVTFVEDDYRTIRGCCDAFVSVGMLEHVPPAGYRELGAVVARCLSPHGRALVHTIARHRRLPPPRWTRRRIFPGGYMPSLSEMSAVFEPNDFVVLDVENLRLHYARTVEHWLDGFERSSNRVAEMFDERFVRAWRIYLASALAGFRSGWLQLFQVVFTHRANNTVPWTRRDEREAG